MEFGFPFYHVPIIIIGKLKSLSAARLTSTKSYDQQLSMGSCYIGFVLLCLQVWNEFKTLSMIHTITRAKNFDPLGDGHVHADNKMFGKRITITANDLRELESDKKILFGIGSKRYTYALLYLSVYIYVLYVSFST